MGQHQRFRYRSMVARLSVSLLAVKFLSYQADARSLLFNFKSNFVSKFKCSTLAHYQSKNVFQETSSSSSAFAHIFVVPRGGALKSKSKRNTKTASLSRDQQKRTATGKRKVGAKTVDTKEGKSALSDSLQKYRKILPLTRVYITMVGVATLLGLILGEEMTQAVLALDPMRVLYGFEIWRPITAATFLGPPSMSWLMSGYYLFTYGSSLERAYGSAQHFVFIASQIILLSILSALLGQPFFASSMITAMLHVLSRAMPNQKIKWLVFTVPYWSLPYGLMTADILQAQSLMAALPHIMGILSGHFYQFHKFVWPKMGGEDWLMPPNFIHQRLDPDAKKELAQSSTGSSKLKSRHQKTGRKLGS